MDEPWGVTVVSIVVVVCLLFGQVVHPWDFEWTPEGYVREERESQSEEE